MSFVPELQLPVDERVRLGRGRRRVGEVFVGGSDGRRHLGPTL